METLGIVFDERYRTHNTGAGHPERPERLDAIASGFRKNGILDTCSRIEPISATDEQLIRVHTTAYMARFKTACASGAKYMDTPDCAISPESHEIARLSAGGVIEACRRVADGEFRRALCAVRPPGHHAESDMAMGFCFFNNVAIAAKELQVTHGFERICILDVDVHHGNATQHCFEADPSVLYVSTHGDPLYLFPHTGFEDEIGENSGKDYTLNIPLKPESDDAAYREAFDRIVVPRIEAYKPQIVIVSSGFDSHVDDPLGNLCMTDEGFEWLTGRMIQLAENVCDGRLVSVIEGGYNLDVLRRCAGKHALQLSQR